MLHQAYMHACTDCAASTVALPSLHPADYAAFDVDVTTLDPGDAALEGIGQRAVIGGASSDWYGTAGGIAYVNSFGRRGMPCYVFSASLGPNNPKVRLSARLLPTCMCQGPATAAAYRM
jgi:hypothetical protein